MNLEWYENSSGQHWNHEPKGDIMICGCYRAMNLESGMRILVVNIGIMNQMLVSIAFAVMGKI